MTDLLSRLRSPRLGQPACCRGLCRRHAKVGSSYNKQLSHHVQVCGRAISVYHKALNGWLEGRVTQFDPELSLHLVEYDRSDGQEAAPEWLRLCSERPWQWLDERAPDAEPNPTSVGRVFDESVRGLEQCKLAVVLITGAWLVGRVSHMSFANFQALPACFRWRQLAWSVG